MASTEMSRYGESKRCPRCKGEFPRESWPRYERNGKLAVHCAVCNQAESEHLARVAQAKARGYMDLGHTPEHKRAQREREAIMSGRALPAYTPQVERERRAGMARAEKAAATLRYQWVLAYLRPFRASDVAAMRELYRRDAEYREKEKAESRHYYSRNRQREVARIGGYKMAHPDRNRAWAETRMDREAQGADGSVNAHVIADLKATATHCAYCGEALDEKQTDHIIPLALGGDHALRNIVIVCPDCNGRKARLTPAEWLERIAPEHRPRVRGLYAGRGIDLSQVERAA